jgi:hypothetical protein
MSFDSLNYIQESVEKEFAEEYDDLLTIESIMSVNSRNYRTVPIVKRLVEEATAQNLRMSHHTYVLSGKQNNKDSDSIYVATSYICGMYPKLPAKRKKPREIDFNQSRGIVYTRKNVITKLVTNAVKEISTETFSMPNPLMAPSVAGYMYDEWVKVLPSLSADIPRFCRLAIDAEVDNSNQLNEAAFRYWKYNKERQEAELNPGTLKMHWWEQDMASNSMFVNDLDHLKERVNEHNIRRSNRRDDPMNDAMIDAMEESRDVPWGEKKDKIDSARDHLNLYMATYPAKCGETDTETHRTERVLREPAARASAIHVFTNVKEVLGS